MPVNRCCCALFVAAIAASLIGTQLRAEETPPVVQMAAFFTTAKGQGRLYIKVTPAAGYHIYGIDQPAGGPIATSITLDPANDYWLVDSWTAKPLPHIHFDAIAFQMDLHEHFERVTFSAPFCWRGDVNASKLEIKGQIKYQACDDGSCLAPRRLPFVARFRPPQLAGAAPLPEIDYDRISLAAPRDAIGEAISTLVPMRIHVAPGKFCRL